MTFLKDWPTYRLEALHRVAKTMPFFRHPRDMMYLRGVLEERKKRVEI